MSTDELLDAAGASVRDSDLLPPKAQVLPFAARFVLSGPRYLFIDSDCRLLSTVGERDFAIAGRSLFELEPIVASVASAETGSRQLLGLKPGGVTGFRVRNQVLQADFVSLLLAHIERLHGQHWANALSSRTGTGMPQWTAAGLYGSYCLEVEHGREHGFAIQNTIVYSVGANSPAGDREYVGVDPEVATWVQLVGPANDVDEHAPAAINLGQRRLAPVRLAEQRLAAGLDDSGRRSWAIGSPPAPQELAKVCEIVDPPAKGSLDHVASYVFVINLESSDRRRALQIEQGYRLGYRFTLYPAVSGRSRAPSDFPSWLITDNTVRRLLGANPGGLAHGATYLELLLFCSRLGQSECVWIMEDDAVVREDAAATLPRAMEALPRNWDVLLLGAVPWHHPAVLFSWQSDARAPGSPGPLSRPNGALQTVAWIISPSGAQKLLSRVLPWDDRANYRDYGRFLRSHGYFDDYPTPGSLDLFLQMQFPEMRVYYAHTYGTPLVYESAAHDSIISDLGRRVDY